MAQYVTCPHCGSNLDPGERCDCAEKKEVQSETAQNDEKKEYVFAGKSAWVPSW